VRPRVPCVSCVSRLPPVSFYGVVDGAHSRATIQLTFSP